MLKKLHIH